MSGFFLITRGMSKHHLFKRKPDRLAVWVWLLDNVAFKDTTQDAKGNTIHVPRGSVCASLRHIADETGVGHQVVRTALKRFESEQMVDTKVTHGKTVITLCNYEKHQRSENETNTSLTQDQHKPNTQKKQGNQGEQKEPIGSLAPTASKKRGSRLSQDWFLPTEWGKWAVDEGWPEETIRAEADKFKDYWHSVAGSKGVKLDWQATWRNWMRNAPKAQTQLKAINGGRDERHRNAYAVNREIAARFADGRIKHDPYM